MQLIGDHLVAIGVPQHYPLEFKRRVFAGAYAYQRSMNSTDYVFKRYSDRWQFPESTPEDSFVLDCLQDAKHHVATITRQLLDLENKPGEENYVASAAALYRMQASFRGAAMMIRAGFHFEAAALLRIILEQLAWIFAIRDVDSSVEDFFEVRPRSCISKLKEWLPDAGPLYGLLSSQSHLEPKETLKYIRKDGKKIEVRLSLREHSCVDAFILVLLADMFVLVAERTYASLLSRPTSIRRNRQGVVVPKRNRQLVATLRKRWKQLKRLEQRSCASV